MPIIYLSDHRPLTEEQKKMAEVTLSNEINDVMANLEIMEDELDRTFLFREFDLRALALGYMNQKLKRNADGNVDEKVLQQVYNWYYSD